MENKYVVGFEGESFIYGFDWEQDIEIKKGDMRWADAIPLPQAKSLKHRLELKNEGFKVILYKLTKVDE